MKIGYIRRCGDNRTEIRPERFRFVECSCTRRVSAESDKVYSKQFRPVDYEEIAHNADFMRRNPQFIIVEELFLLDDELRKKAIRWVEWANQADTSEYDPFAKWEEA